ncbi:MAG TPA: phosphatase PAP2 family protein [Gemmatimonadales bacterium]|nr:phosphatase PAP2 family protein [Gemmatimonadales bacterium]
MLFPKRWSQILCAASAVVLASCGDRPTEPGTPLTDRSSSPDATAVKFWEAGSSVAWNGIARDFLMAPGRAFNPFLESRVLTYLSLAQYNAIIAAENSRKLGTHASRAGAAAGASVVVLKDFFPSSAEADLIDNRIAAQEAGSAWPGETHADFAAGEDIGRSIGAAVVAYAHTDNTGLAPLPTQLTGPGYWTGTAPVRGLFGTRPLTLTSADQFRSLPPPLFGSAGFLTDLAEVQGLSTSHTVEQVALAVFWNIKVARYQNEIATDLIVSHRRSEREAARILALANIAGFDALIGCWDAKFTYWYIRPWQVDPSIGLPIGAPNHPSYPSGHSCVTAAYSEILGQAFPDERPGLAANIEAAGQSRINGGLHYRFDIVAGQVLGRQVAEHVLASDVAGHEPIPLD